MALPGLLIYSQEFWRARIEGSAGEVHRSVYRVAQATWESISREHRSILGRVIQDQAVSLLDCGCGYGALLDLVPPTVKYVGVDLSPDFVALAQATHPGGEFSAADLRALPFPDNSFDLAVCRSVGGMVVRNAGADDWYAMQREILRVAGRLLLLNYSDPSAYRVLTEPTSSDPVFD